MEPYSSPEKKEIQDSLGFWIPLLEFEVLDSKSLSEELGFLISFVSGIPDSKFPRFRNPNYMGRISQYTKEHTAISRKVVGKSARDNPERHCGWFWVLFFFFNKKFERIGTKGHTEVFASAKGKQQK